MNMKMVVMTAAGPRQVWRVANVDTLRLVAAVVQLEVLVGLVEAPRASAASQQLSALLQQVAV